MRVATQVKTRIQKTFVASLIFASAIDACADTRTWSGNGADANWGTPANWGGSVPVSGDALVFSGALNLVNTNNLSAGTAFSGVNETVGWLVLGGKLRRAGTYGATGSGAAVIDDVHFAGSGLLTVLHDKSGTLMKMR